MIQEQCALWNYPMTLFLGILSQFIFSSQRVKVSVLVESQKSLLLAFDQGYLIVLGEITTGIFMGEYFKGD